MSRWKKFLIRWKDAFAAARTVLKVRKSGEMGCLALTLEDELRADRYWLSKRDYENQLMQKCIIDGITEGASPCWWCEEREDCEHKEHMKGGCGDWWLRFLTEEEERACEQRAEAGGEEAAAEQPARADEDAED